MSFTVKADIKKVFFDRAQVASWIGKKQAAFLNNAGGYVRRVARNSMKLKGKARKKNTTALALREIAQKPASPPGSPPYAHNASDVTTLRNIQYGLSDNREGVLVGPLRLNQKSTINAITAAGTVPQLHEFSGTKAIKEKLENIAPVIARQKAARRGKPLTANQISAIRRKRPALQKYIPGKRWIPMGRSKPLPGQPVRVRHARYPSRPFMLPAMQKSLPKFPSLFFSASDSGAGRAA